MKNEKASIVMLVLAIVFSIFSFATSNIVYMIFAFLLILLLEQM